MPKTAAPPRTMYPRCVLTSQYSSRVECSIIITAVVYTLEGLANLET